MRARRSRLASALVLAPAALAASPLAHAQLFEPELVRALGVREFGPPTPGAPTPAVTRCVAGEVTADARVDAMIAVAGSARLAWAPGRYNAFPQLAASASDVAMLPPATPGHAGTPLTLDAVDGLVAHVHDSTTESFANVALGSVAWRTASQLHVAALDTAGSADVYALGANGLSVLLLVALDTGAPVEGSFALTQPATGIVALDWSATANRELAIATANTIEVRRLSGTGGLPLPIAGAGARLAVLERPPSGGYERLAAVTRSGGVDVLHVAGFGLQVATLALGDQQVSHIASADLDLDGRTDLVLTRAVTGNPLFLLQHADGSFALDAESSGTIDVGVPDGGAAEAPLALGDFDGDGDADVLAYAPALHGFVLAGNRTHMARHATPPLHALELVETIPDVGVEPEFELALGVALPLTPLAGATHFEITVWRQGTPDGGPALVAVDRLLVPNDPLPLDGDWRTSLPFENADDVRLLYEIEAREVALGLQGELLAGGPSAVACYSADLVRLEEFAIFQAIDFAVALAVVPWIVVLPPGQIGATSRLDTGIVPLGDVPKFEDDDDPPSDSALPDPKGGG